MSNLIGQYITATLMRRFYDVMCCCFLSFFFSVNYVKMLYMRMYECMYVKFGESWWRDDKSSTHGSLSRCICTECTLDICSQFGMHRCHYSARASVYVTQYTLFAMGNQVTSLFYADKKRENTWDGSFFYNKTIIQQIYLHQKTNPVLSA